mgnify:CR=1 FL=1
MVKKHSILIVDDDELILQDLKQKCNSYGPPFFVEHLASSAAAAQQILNTYDISVLITDIQMPQIDGLTLIAQVRKQYPALQIAIVSGHENFSYAQSAMKYGIHTYLLKPVSEADLHAYLAEVAAQLETDSKEQENQVLLRTLRGMQYIPANFPTLHTQQFFLLLINWGNLQTKVMVSSNLEEYYRALNSASFSALCRQVFAAASTVFIADGSAVNQKYILIADDGNTCIFEAAEALYLKLSALLRQHPLSVFFDADPFSLDLLTKQAYALRKLTSKQLIMGKGVLCCAQSPYILNPPVNTSLSSKRLITLLAGENRPAFCSEFSVYFADLVRRGYSQRQMEDAMIAILGTIGAHFPEISPQQINHARSQILEACAYQTNNAKAAEDISEALLQCCLGHPPVSATQIQIDQISKYIDENYCMPVTLESLAETFHLSASYLTRSFKKALGVTPMHYLQQLRIKEAKALLLSRPELSVRSIAELCGYTDQHYFSRVFQKAVGISPTEFRKS